MSDPASGEFESLRTILVGPEQEQLRRLEDRISDVAKRADDVSEVLPRAIGIRASRDQKLQRVIQPVLEEVLRISVQKNPRILADALFPIIGAAIRKALAAALETMMQSFTQLQEQSLSLRGVGWRLQAIRTGKSFGEIVLLRSLLYRVEQVFLIHRETGLLLWHREAADVVSKDADMVSAMLSAINDFVSDSFGASGADTRDLDQIQVGGVTVWIQHGPLGLLAGVVRGTAPRELRNVFAESIEEIHQRFAPELAAFDGDAIGFAEAAPALDRCLLGKGADLGGGRGYFAWAVAGGAILAALLLWAGYAAWRHNQWERYLGRLRAEPGIVLTDSRYRDVAGLRDPLARDPLEVLRETGIGADGVQSRWEPYHSLAPRFVSARRMRAAQETIERQKVYFESGKSVLGAQQADALGRVAIAMRDYIDAMGDARGGAGGGAVLEITGQADSTGDPATNLRVAAERARRAGAALVEQGVPAGCLRTASVPGSANRAVSFRLLDARREASR